MGCKRNQKVLTVEVLPTEDKSQFVGSPFDWFGIESHPDYMDLTEEQIANRHIFWDAMFGHGFKGIDSEWWHFTLKDEPFPDTYFTFPVKQL